MIGIAEQAEDGLPLLDEQGRERVVIIGGKGDQASGLRGCGSQTCSASSISRTRRAGFGGAGRFSPFRFR